MVAIIDGCCFVRYVQKIVTDMMEQAEKTHHIVQEAAHLYTRLRKHLICSVAGPNNHNLNLLDLIFASIRP